jgi:Na+-driven multidrug efflux pump
LFSFSLLMFFPKAILSIFITPDPSRDQLIAMGVPILRTIVIMSPIVGIQIVAATLFQSVGRAGPSLFLSLLRQVILYIPLLLILPHFMDCRARSGRCRYRISCPRRYPGHAFGGNAAVQDALP